MTVYEIKLAGSINKKTGLPIAFATIHQDRNDSRIRVSITDYSPTSTDNERVHWVETDNEDDLFSMAQCLQERLDGRRGSNSEIHDYYRLLQYFIQ
jgi:hypothetical protein